jgi:hypothetical protein
MGVDDQNIRLRGEMRAESGVSPASRRAFLAGTGAAAGAAAVAALLGGPLAEAARAAEPGGSLPNYAPVPKSALGPPLNADGWAADSSFWTYASQSPPASL